LSTIWMTTTPRAADIAMEGRVPQTGGDGQAPRPKTPMRSIRQPVLATASSNPPQKF
jgi:hypothetical protein